MAWIETGEKLPPVPPNFYVNESDVVLAWVGENAYSQREVTTAYYDYHSKAWQFIESGFSHYVREPLAWMPFPTPPGED